VPVLKKAVIIVSCFCHFAVMSQELEPRVYGNLPKNLNAVAFVYGLSKGNVLADPSLPITGFEITAHNLGLAYVRTFGLANRLARVQASVPFMNMIGNLQVNGRDTTGTRTGFGDMRLRFGVNIIGSEALDRKEFARYQQKTIIGISLVTSIPMGMYDADKRINIGSNRWGFKPEIGISRRFKRFYVEGYTGVWFYTNNTKYLETKTLEQKPVFSFQGHVLYTINKMWFGINWNWFSGGETIVDGVSPGALKNNWRVGGTWSLALTPKHSLKLQFHVGAFTNVGYDYNIALIGYQYVFF
jgi:hypothetical protein